MDLASAYVGLSEKPDHTPAGRLAVLRVTAPVNVALRETTIGYATVPPIRYLSGVDPTARTNPGFPGGSVVDVVVIDGEVGATAAPLTISVAVAVRTTPAEFAVIRRS